jgi:hypothetical protein
MVWPSLAAGSKQLQNGQQNYFKLKDLIFCTQQILNY